MDKVLIVIQFIGQPFVKRFALCYWTVVLSVCDVGVLWQNGWTVKMKLDMWVGLGPGHIVLDGDPAPLPTKGHSPSPIFSPYLLSQNGLMDQDTIW